MKTPGALALALLCACGSAKQDSGAPPPYVVNAGSTVNFAPVEVVTNRSVGCGATDAPFATDDDFTLTAITDPRSPPNTQIEVEMRGSVAVGTAHPLSLLPVALGVGPGLVGASMSADSLGPVGFTFTWGGPPAELDLTQLSTVVVTVVALPSGEGDPLIAHCVLTFQDGRVLDVTLSGATVTVASSCLGAG